MNKDSESVLSFSGLGHAYFPGQWVFREYAASVTRGSVFALLGPNGCGKTTLLKILLGVLKPSAGKVVVSGQIGFVPQIFQVSFDYSVLDMVVMGRVRRIGLFAQPSRQDEAAAFGVLERFGLSEYAHRPFHQLSGGQRQLAILARALVAEADLLILDEPTSALDLHNQALVLEWINRLARTDGLTILFTTHHPHHALAVADTALLMNGDNHYAMGPVATVLSDENLRTLYKMDLKRVTYQHGTQELETLVPIYPLQARSRRREA